MNFAKHRQLYYIDSGKRIKGTSSDFSFKLDTSKSDKFDHCTVLQASIPFTYYLIEDGFNTFELKETGHSAVTVTIPKGNYNINSFSKIVGPLLTAASALNSTYTLTYPASFTATNTAFITCTITGGTATNSQLIFTSTNTICEQFGFDSGSTQTFSTDTLVSSNTVNFLTNRSLLIHSDIIDGGATNILQEIYSNNSQVNGNIVYQSTDALAYSKPLKAAQQNVINIFLSDINGVRINLNGADMNITLLMYQANRTTEIIERFIKFIAESHLSQPQALMQAPVDQTTNPSQTNISNPVLPDPTLPVDDTEPIPEDEQAFINDIDHIKVTTRIALDYKEVPRI